MDFVFDTVSQVHTQKPLHQWQYVLWVFPQKNVPISRHFNGKSKTSFFFIYFIGSELDTRYDLVRDFDSIVYEKRDYCYDNRGRSDGK